MLSIKVKPSPSANIRRLAETGLSSYDIRQVTGYSDAAIKRALTSRRPLKR